MKPVLFAIATLVLVTSASAQTFDAAEAARRDTDPVLNGYVRDVPPQGMTAAPAPAPAAQVATGPAINNKTASVQKGKK